MRTCATPSIPVEGKLPIYHSLVAHDMEQVDAVIVQWLASDVALVGQVAGYIVQAGGKRLRPALLLLMTGLLKGTSAHRHKLAATIEFIHTATLLHDDVVDGSGLRRGKATANATFGNAASVLVGDFLYSRAFQMMVEIDHMQVLSILADATNTIAEGEVLQLMNVHNATLSVERYLQVIESKTARLFEAAAELGAVLAGASTTLQGICASYGAALGTAFQLVDDVLDYMGNAREMGKNLGDDLREGKVTLPLIVAMQRSSEADAALVRRAIEKGDLGQLDQILRIVQECNAPQESLACAQKLAQKALSCIVSIAPQETDPSYRAALLELPELLLARRH